MDFGSSRGSFHDHFQKNPITFAEDLCQNSAKGMPALPLSAIGITDRELGSDEQGITDAESIWINVRAAGVRSNAVLTSGGRRSVEPAKRIREVFRLLVFEEFRSASVATILKV